MSCLLFIALLIITNSLQSSGLLANTVVFTNNERPPHVISGKLPSKSSVVDVFVNLKKMVHQVNVKFASVTIDSALFAEHWPAFDFKSVRLRTLAKGLSPAYLRFGGTASDFLVFRNHDTASSNALSLDEQDWTDIDYGMNVERKNFTQFCMSASDFDDLNRFAKDVGWRLVFDLNVLLRGAGNHWNSSNAHELLQYAVEQHYDDNIDLELGNEPNSFPSALQRTVSPEQLAADFMSLKAMLKTEPFIGKFCSTQIIGPSVSQPKPETTDFLARFLRSINNTIDAISVHHYYIDGELATAANMTSPVVLDSLASKLLQLRQTVLAAGYSRTPVWLGETGSCWRGGAKDLSDRYIAGFMLLDKLGLAALMNVNVVARQSFFNGNYALVDKDSNPNPDYWLTWLYKNLVGQRVLAVQTSDSEHIRLYAHCTYTPSCRTKSSESAPNGSLTLYGLNLRGRNVSLKFDSYLHSLDKHIYWLLPGKIHKLTSKLVSMSGKTLHLVDDRTFPQISPTVTTGGQEVILPAKSFGFIVIPNARAPACLGRGNGNKWKNYTTLL